MRENSGGVASESSENVVEGVIEVFRCQNDPPHVLISQTQYR